MKSNSGLSDDRIFSMVIDNQNVLWISTIGGRITRYDDKDWSTWSNYYSGLIDDRIFSIGVDIENHMWFGAENGLMEFDGRNWNVYNYNWITAIGTDYIGNRWFGGSSILKYDEQTWNTFNSSNSGVPHYNYSTILTDQHGNMWFANDSHGLIKYNGEIWTIYNTSNSWFAK